MDEPCSALDPISTLAVEDLISSSSTTSRSSSSPTTCSRPRRVSDPTAFFNIAGAGSPGRLIEMGDTATIFSNPEVKATEDYISGPVRLGRSSGGRPGTPRAGYGQSRGGPDAGHHTTANSSATSTTTQARPTRAPATTQPAKPLRDRGATTVRAPRRTEPPAGAPPGRGGGSITGGDVGRLGTDRQPPEQQCGDAGDPRDEERLQRRERCREDRTDGGLGDDDRRVGGPPAVGQPPAEQPPAEPVGGAGDEQCRGQQEQRQVRRRQGPGHDEAAEGQQRQGRSPARRRRRRQLERPARQDPVARPRHGGRRVLRGAGRGHRSRERQRGGGSGGGRRGCRRDRRRRRQVDAGGARTQQRGDRLAGPAGGCDDRPQDRAGPPRGSAAEPTRCGAARTIGPSVGSSPSTRISPPPDAVEHRNNRALAE